MRYITFIFLFSFLFPSISNASFTYINVTSTTKVSTLKKTTYTLKRLKQKTTHRTTKTRYIIYTGPYTSTKSAQIALMKVKRYFPSAKIVKTRKQLSKYKKTTRNTPKNTTLAEDKGYFLSAALGYGSAPVTNTGSIDMYLPEEKGISYDLAGGYYLRDYLFITGGYLKFDAKDVVFDNLYASLNYKTNNYWNFNPYVGILVGFSKLTWNKNPIDNTSEKSSNQSESMFVGTQVGTIYKVHQNTSLFINYQCLFMNHSTTVSVDAASSELKHTTVHNLQFGVRYSL